MRIGKANSQRMLSLKTWTHSLILSPLTKDAGSSSLRNLHTAEIFFGVSREGGEECSAVLLRQGYGGQGRRTQRPGRARSPRRGEGRSQSSDGRRGCQSDDLRLLAPASIASRREFFSERGEKYGTDRTHRTDGRSGSSSPTVVKATQQPRRPRYPPRRIRAGLAKGLPGMGRDRILRSLKKSL
jgi:hypothetical protein